jgi:ubiquinone/menaquinone biosynthesis C-methylase UbiE
MIRAEVHSRHHPRLYDAVLAPFEWLGLRRLRRAVVAAAEGRVLEIGAGTGRNLPLYRRAEILIATDPDAAMLARARRCAAQACCPVLLVVADAQALPFRDAAFDTAVATLVFCSVPDPAAGFAETRRVLKPWVTPGTHHQKGWARQTA